MNKKSVRIPKFRSESEEANWWASPAGRTFVKQKSAEAKSKRIKAGGSRLVAMLNKMASTATVRLFDLNIEKILEGWQLCHATRELISNALDEQALSSTKEITINRASEGNWKIRDYGRGLRYEHLTQNENEEKLQNSSKVIGRFGVGLKDALATFSRLGVDVHIRSRFGEIDLRQSAKHGFDDVITLHAAITPPSDAALAGTEITLIGIPGAEVIKAKDFFLKFSGEPQLEATQYGQILSPIKGKPSRIYVNGIVVAEEQNFAFSYNITSLTATMRRALNRERTNVGRTAYSDRVKSMLLAASSAGVANTLAAELERVQLGTNADEVGWLDVAVHGCQILNATGKVLFATASELVLYPEAIDRARSDGYRVVNVPENVRLSLRGLKDISGQNVRDLNVYDAEWQQSFKFKFVPVSGLTKTERDVFEQREAIGRLVGGLPSRVKEVVVSETMRPETFSGGDTDGLWEASTGRIIIKRSQLSSLAAFAGTLLHEIAHAKSGFGDVSRDFELVLTDFLSQTATRALSYPRPSSAKRG